MEDQPHESGDVNPGESVVEAPQGKAARRRHRLPRHNAANVVVPQDAAAVGDEEPDVEAADRSATDAATEVKTAAAEDDSATSDASDDASAASADAAEDAAEEPAASAEAPAAAPVTLVPHRPVGRKLLAASIIAAALFVSASAFAGAAMQPYLADRALVQTKFEVAKTASAAVTTLWSYTPDDMEKLGDRSQQYLSGGFADEYRKFVDSIVASNKQAQITSQTKVMGAAVESISANEAAVIVYTNSVATSPLTKGIPSLRYQSYRLVMKRHNADWKVGQMTLLTKLDLTPQL